MSRILPILFNTGMVQAILDGRKTVTRRVVKNADRLLNSPYRNKNSGTPDHVLIEKLIRPPMGMGDRI